MPCVFVNSWHCQYFFLSQAYFQYFLSHFPLIQLIELERTKPGSATPIFLSFYVTFMNSKSGLEINGGFYVLIFTVFVRNQVDNIAAVRRQVASDIIKPTSDFTLKLIISYQIIFGDVTCFTGFYTTFTFLRFSRKQGRW